MAYLARIIAKRQKTRAQYKAKTTHPFAEMKFMSDKIVELEVKIAFLEQSITELSDVVYSQQKQIDSLRNDQHRMRTHLQSLDKDAQTAIDDQPPPHY